MTIFEGAVQVFAAWLFGYAFALGDLLERHDYRWFRGAPLAIGGAAGMIGVGMLWLSLDGVRGFWLAALLTWIVLGRVFVPGKLLMTALVGSYLALWCVTADNLDPPALGYFVVTLLTLGALAAGVRRARGRVPGWLALVCEREHWAWYAVCAGYLYFFDFDLGLIAVIWAFQAGRQDLKPANAGRLMGWGIKPPAFGAR